MKCTHCGGSGVEPAKEKVDHLMLELLEILKTPRAKVTKGRLTKLNMRRKEFSDEDVMTAAINLSKSPWHMGDNPGNVKYATIDFLLRNDETVDKWLNMQPVQEKKFV